MKKILIAILFFAFTLSANSQIEEIEVEEVETITSVKNYANLGAELRKKEEYQNSNFNSWVSRTSTAN